MGIICRSDRRPLRRELGGRRPACRSGRTGRQMSRRLPGGSPRQATRKHLGASARTRPRARDACARAGPTPGAHSRRGSGAEHRRWWPRERL